MDDQITEMDGMFGDVWDELSLRLHADVSEAARAHAHGKLPAFLYLCST